MLGICAEYVQNTLAMRVDTDFKNVSNSCPMSSSNARLFFPTELWNQCSQIWSSNLPRRTGAQTQRIMPVNTMRLHVRPLNMSGAFAIRRSLIVRTKRNILRKMPFCMCVASSPVPSMSSQSEIAMARSKEHHVFKYRLRIYDGRNSVCVSG